jgi:hypothetical protein
MRGVSSDDASQSDNGVEGLSLRQFPCSESEFEATGDVAHYDIFRLYAVFLEGSVSAFEEFLRDVFVPFGNYDTYPGV